MNLIAGYIKVQLFYQEILKYDLPYLYDTANERIYPNPKLSNRWKMPIWGIVNIATTIMTISGILMAVHFLQVADQISHLNLEGFAINGMIFVTSLQQLITLQAYEKDPITTTYMVSTIFNMCGGRCRNKGNCFLNQHH